MCDPVTCADFGVERNCCLIHASIAVTRVAKRRFGEALQIQEVATETRKLFGFNIRMDSGLAVNHVLSRFDHDRSEWVRVREI
jgi:hypothetical protein